MRWCREGNGPYFLELTTYRWREHVGPNPDGRDKSEVDSWVARCPIGRATEVLRDTDPDIDRTTEGWRQESLAEITEAIAVAKASPFPAVTSLLHGAYAPAATAPGRDD